MNDLLTSLLAVILTIYVKCVARNDAQFSFRKEDFAVGLEIAVVAVLTFTAAPAKATVPNYTAVPWYLLGMVFTVLATSAFIRKYGWDSDGRLRLGLWIVLPNVVGLAMLVGVVAWLRA